MTKNGQGGSKSQGRYRTRDIQGTGRQVREETPKGVDKKEMGEGVDRARRDGQGG